MVKQTHYLFNLFSTDPRRRAQHYDVVAAAAEAVGTDWYYLGELGFAAEEDGRFAEARDLAEASLEVHPDNVSAAHVLAHTYLETADLRQGDEWLSKWLRSWDAPSEFACHLTWHLALLRLADDREVDREPRCRTQLRGTGDLRGPRRGLAALAPSPRLRVEPAVGHLGPPAQPSRVLAR